MRRTLTISLPERVRKDLDRVAEQEGTSRSDIIRESLRDYLFARQLRSLRRRLLAKARSRGVYTDDDVFNRVS